MKQPSIPVIYPHTPRQNKKTGTKKKKKRDKVTYRKYALDDEIVILLQAALIPFSKRVGKFGVRVALGCLESLIRERQTAKKPHEAFCRRTFLLGLFIADEELKGDRLGGMGEIPGTDFLERGVRACVYVCALFEIGGK